MNKEISKAVHEYLSEIGAKGYAVMRKKVPEATIQEWRKRGGKTRGEQLRKKK